MGENRVDSKNLTGPQKAAIFLLSLGEEYTSEIFRRLNDQEIKKVATAMADIDEIPSPAVAKVMDEFIQTFEAEDRTVVQGESFLKSVVNKALDMEKGQAILKEIEERKRERPFGWSREVDVETLSAHIKGEHPQTIAMILAHFPAEIASEILVSLPEEKKGDIALRIAQLGKVPDEIIREVDHALRAGLSSMGRSGAEAGGLKTLVSILNNVDKATEDIIIETIEEEDEDLASDIRELMFVFEDLVGVDDRGMREILKRVESQQLVLAMKTASEEMKQKILSNLSSRAAEMLQEDLEVLGPVRLTEVESAQQEIVRAAKELEAEGTIVLGGKGKEDVLV
jgi:flagellar motor switch protein FliG